MPAGASGPHRGGYWPPSARSAVPKSKIRWLPRLRILTDSKKVAITIWEHEMGADGFVDYFGDPTLATWSSKPGNQERIRNLQIARDHCNALFHVIWVVARDLEETPRKIAGRYPENDLMMKLIDLDETTGAFSAVLVEHVHRLGNLTLLTTQLDSSVSNRAWSGKREALTRHDVLLINRELRDAESWTEASIERRTADAISAVLRTWPVPEDHTATRAITSREADTSWIDFRHVVAVGLVAEGTRLRARSPHDASATVLADGRLQVNGEVFDSPSGAGKAVRRGATNGWQFWILPDGRRLNTLKEPYLRLLDARRTAARDDVEG